jgi:hypothetical protein
VNFVHALLSVAIAHDGLADGFHSIGIVTPYAAQARLIHRLLEVCGMVDTVDAATVHRFQGSEKDLVIVDLVDAEPIIGASKLTGTDADQSRRVLTVATSRARSKLVVIANRQFINSAHPDNSTSRTLLSLLESNGFTEQAEPHEIAVSTRHIENIRLLTWAGAQEAILASLNRQNADAIVNLPEALAGDISGDDLLRLAQRTRHLTVLAPRRAAKAIEHTSADVRLMTKPAGLVWSLDHEAAIVGSTRPEGLFATVNGEPAVRMIEELTLGPRLGGAPPDADRDDELARIFGVCSECGEERKPRRQPQGMWVIGCSSPNHHTSPIGVDVLQEIAALFHVVCPTCGGDAIARSGRYGVFLSCPRHSSGCDGRPAKLEDLFPQ